MGNKYLEKDESHVKLKRKLYNKAVEINLSTAMH